MEIGIRPEDIGIAHGDTGDGLRATVVVIEPMGSLNVVYARLGDERLAITTAPTFWGQLGDPVTLTFAADKTHLFDPASEHVLGWGVRSQE